MLALPIRPLVALATVTLALAAVGAQASAHGHGGAAHRQPAARAASGASVTLDATVSDDDLATIVSFQYGTTTAYGSTSTSLSVNALLLSTTVSVTIGGLTPGVTYHYRVVASNLLGTTYGSDQTFTIAASGSGSVGTGTGGSTTVTTTTTVSASGGSGSGVTVGTGGGSSGASTPVGTTGPAGTTGATGATGASGSSGSATAPGSGGGASTNGQGSIVGSTGVSATGAALPPEIQRTAVVSDTTGVVVVQPPGASRPVAVSGSLDVPDGTFIDAHAGVVDLTTALDTHGHTQTVMVWGEASACTTSPDSTAACC